MIFTVYSFRVVLEILCVCNRHSLQFEFKMVNMSRSHHGKKNLMQDDVVARLEASETQESVKLGGSENSTNPAGNSAKESEEGLAKLDADAGIDSTSVEDKVERVATAIERDEESPNEGMV